MLAQRGLSPAFAKTIWEQALFGHRLKSDHQVRTNVTGNFNKVVLKLDEDALYALALHQ